MPMFYYFRYIIVFFFLVRDMANDTVQKSSQSSAIWNARHVLAVFGLFGVGFIEMGVIKSFGVLIDEKIS